MSRLNNISHSASSRQPTNIKGHFLAGLAALIDFSGPGATGFSKKPRVNGSLKGDFAKIGADMHIAFSKERQRARSGN